MIELGKKQTLVVVREKDFGIYLAEKQSICNGYSLSEVRYDGIWRKSPVHAF